MEDDDDYESADAGGGGGDDALAGLMQRLAGISTADPVEQGRQFAELLGISQEQAAFFLGAASGNLEAAVNLFLDYSRSAGPPAAPAAAPPQRSDFYLDAQRTGFAGDIEIDGDTLVAARLAAVGGAGGRFGLADGADWESDSEDVPPELLAALEAAGAPPPPGAAPPGVPPAVGVAPPSAFFGGGWGGSCSGGFGAGGGFPGVLPVAAGPPQQQGPPPPLPPGGGGMDTSGE